MCTAYDLIYTEKYVMISVKELSGLHDKHLHRPTLDDSVDEEHAIEILTQEVTQVLSECQIMRFEHRNLSNYEILTRKVVKL